MKCRELDALITKSADATTKKDDLFLMELRSIAAILDKCGADEIYSGEITRRFCHLLSELKAEADIPWAPEYEQDHRFVTAERQQLPDCNGEKLLCRFYNRFRNEKKGESAEQPQYPAIEQLSDLKYMEFNITLKDYVARIRTFANRYLWEIPNVRKMWDEECQIVYGDEILFTYKHIEYFLAAFNTKQENGEPDKQKVNIRSALRRLNQFKQEQGNG